jgi:hypothetical protein
MLMQVEAARTFVWRAAWNVDYAPEKFYRNAITITHMDGANTVAALRTGALIRGEHVGGWMG